MCRLSRDVLNNSVETGRGDTPLFVDPLCRADPQAGAFRFAARIAQCAQRIGSTSSHLDLRAAQRVPVKRRQRGR
jgi:hypothetical protein